MERQNEVRKFKWMQKRTNYRRTDVYCVLTFAIVQEKLFLLNCDFHRK